MAMKIATSGLMAEGVDGRVYPMMTVFDDVNGQIVAKEGTANLSDNNGQPMTLLMEAAWQTVDPKVLLEAIQRGTIYREKEIPVKQIRGGYADGVSVQGYLVQLNAEDRELFGATNSIAHRIVNGERETLNGVIAITRDAYCLLLEKTSKLKVKETFTPQPETRPISTGDLLQSIAFTRVNGPVIHQVELNNGQVIKKAGGLAGDQRQKALALEEEAAKKMAEERMALSPFANMRVEVIEPSKTSSNNNIYRMPIRRR